MLGKKLASFFKTSSKPQITSSTKTTTDEGKSKSLGRKAVSFVLMTVTGGVALSALNDLAIYHGCSSKALEKASKNQALIDAFGEPIVRGPWYNASLAVAQKRHSVSCTFPVSGPQGTGTFQLKAIRNRGDTWYSNLWPRDWEILIMDALLHVPTNEEKERVFRINLFDAPTLPTSTSEESTSPSPSSSPSPSPSPEK